MTRLLLILTLIQLCVVPCRAHITVVASWDPVENADRYQVIMRSNIRADTFYTADTCMVMPIMPYRMHEFLAATIADCDTSAFSDAVYCIGFGHDENSESRVMFSVDSLSLIMAVDSIAEFHMMTGEDFLGFYIRGERDECPVVRTLR